MGDPADFDVLVLGGGGPQCLAAAFMAGTCHWPRDWAFSAWWRPTQSSTEPVGGHSITQPLLSGETYLTAAEARIGRAGQLFINMQAWPLSQRCTPHEQEAAGTLVGL